MRKETKRESDFVQRLTEHAQAISKKYNSDILIYSGSINGTGDARVLSEIVNRANKASKNIHVFLTTYGGSPDSAYRIARCIQRHYTEGSFTLVVGWYCKSAGTMIAIGADEIVMAEAAELGPLDTQVSKPDELVQTTSGLGSFQAVKTLRQLAFQSFEGHFLDLTESTDGQLTARTVSEIASKMTIGMLSPIYAQIDPMRLADDARALLISQSYGERLAPEPGGNRGGNLKAGAMEKLINSYPSHSFVIDIEEAKGLFETVRTPCSDENALIQLVDPIARRTAAHEPIVLFHGLEIAETEAETTDERAYELPAVAPAGRVAKAGQATSGDPRNLPGKAAPAPAAAEPDPTPVAAAAN